MESYKTKAYPNVKKWLWRATLFGPSFWVIIWVSDIYTAWLYPENYPFGSEMVGSHLRTQGTYILNTFLMLAVGVLSLFGELLCRENLIGKLSRPVNVSICLLLSVLILLYCIKSLGLISNSMDWIALALFECGRYVLYIWLLFILLKAGSDWFRQRRGDSES